MTIAQIILEQLGNAGKLRMMIGAKSFVDIGNGLEIRYTAKSKNKSNIIRIELNEMDTYDVTYSKLYAMNVTERSKSEGIYCDMLVADIERETGLYMSL